jgi:phosphatidylserine/phosphatidylglycerophosphate/cardiolipin synthase-like enzyme
MDFLPCCGHSTQYEDPQDETQDNSAGSLSYVGTAAYDVLRTYHGWHHHSLWNVTSGKVVGPLHQTPRTGWACTDDPPPGHDDWFPEKLGEIISRTESFCDIMSLGPPDGLFLVEMKKALGVLANKATAMPEHPIVIRIMFGNIVGMPVNCTAVIKALTADLAPNPNIRLWVGAWRKGVSWNHAKIIAVDGHYLHTGGHNLWDPHYLKNNPVHDLSLEMEGNVTKDGHHFANEQWAFVESTQTTVCGTIVDRLPDAMPLLWKTRVTISEFPIGIADTFPPPFDFTKYARRAKAEGTVPIISVGRYGSILFKSRPSDDAFLAMMDASKTIIRMALQDLGPVCIPGSKIPLPGCVWPKATMAVLGRAIWERGVDVEIAVSNPGSIPGGLTPTEANYGNGWSCVDVAAEIIKTIQKQFPSAKHDELRVKVAENLRVSFIRETCGRSWKDGKTMGMHSKHFIIDDVCCYIGSQNLYICDLAEWGVIIDNEAQTKSIMEEYWVPMWKSSYMADDCNVQSVMDGLKINRNAQETSMFTTTTQMEATAARQTMRPAKSQFFYDKDGED